MSQFDRSNPDRYFREWTHLRQTSPLDQYIVDCQRLPIIVPDVKERRLILLFIVGLIDAFTRFMKAFEPSSLHGAIRKAHDL